jgi:hypothetical protein
MICWGPPLESPAFLLPLFIHTYEVENEAREWALRLPTWQEENKKLA